MICSMNASGADLLSAVAFEEIQNAAVAQDEKLAPLSKSAGAA